MDLERATTPADWHHLDPVDVEMGRLINRQENYPDDIFTTERSGSFVKLTGPYPGHPGRLFRQDPMAILP